MEDTVISPIKALCNAVSSRSDFQQLKNGLDDFLGNEALKFQFQQVNEIGRHLQSRANEGEEIGALELKEFDSLRSELTENPVVQNFLRSQNELQQLHQIVGKFLDKTFKLGRCPEIEEVESGCCGGGCGCD
jgi:cell fate (sporulation/competence/biofilm development) regulator YlbF (YheA/YmcA/DUF963 family)